MIRAAAFSALLLLASPIAAQTVAELQTRAAGGDRDAQFLLGEAYRTGQGVAADRDQAVGWFRKSAAQGDSRAADALGILLFTKGNRQEAISLLQAAAARQDPRALYLLGTAHFNGDGVPRDLARAYAEMKAAADRGLPQAVRSLQLMEPYLRPEDRAAAAVMRPGSVAPAASPTQAPLPATPPSSSPVPPPLASPAAVPLGRAAPAPIARVALPPSTSPAATEPLPATRTPLAPPVASAAAAAPALPRPAPVAAPATPPPAPVRQPVPEVPATPGGRFRVQLGALGTQAGAEDHWRTLVRKLPSLSRLSHVVVPAGAVWRLQATGLASYAEAQSQCAAVKAQGGDCLPLKP